MKKVQGVTALPLSFAAGVVLIVAGTLARPPLSGVLYLVAVLAGAGAAYLPLGVSGQEEEAAKRSVGKERAWYEVVENLKDPQPEADDGAASS